ncbi:hypothetical protein [Algirhabdus cladophorae]|uniref:hypothetical protein n=1 Tax=Algirhabdus cladophorae TaxID=3377108 RepID=UPI003B84ABE8
MEGQLIWAPLLDWSLLAFAAVVISLVVGLSIWRGLKGWPLRALAGLALLLGLANPSFMREDRDGLSDIVIAVVDESASQGVSDRPDQTQTALTELTASINARPNTELKVVTVADGPSDTGTLVMTALNQALADVPRARVAGVVVISDGQIHDSPLAPDLPAPLHLLQTGKATDWDRRLSVKNAPAFAILGEEVILTLRIDDQGDAPAGVTRAPLEISIDGAEPLQFQVPIGEDLELPVTLPHGGMNVLQFTVPTAEGELTDRNNSAVIQMNGVRDRLRVLLVSGEPHPGERTWRNLLKSDSSVDLVHFTILRPPEKQDGVPVDELSLIAFPTRELFLEKIDEFDLIIFDRYKRRGILPSAYFQSISSYVQNGGAVLIAAGPDYASADSIYRSPLGDILPGAPTARVFEEGYLPRVSDLGVRHPVTEGLTGAGAAEADPEWGRWMRHIEIEATGGQTVMTGVDDTPLLVLDRVAEGRVALMASDHAWLWSRGFEGGGPQLELLRRLAHWMMKEPELEEEALFATADGQTMTITRRTLEDDVSDVEVTGPDGAVIMVPMQEVSPGRFEATLDAPEIGLYRLAEADKSAVIALGPAAPREFVDTIATSEVMAPSIEARRGGAMLLEAGFPAVRTVSEGRVAAGRGWIGITPRNAYVTTDVKVLSLVPAWLFLALSALLAIGAWLLEGRRRP